MHLKLKINKTLLRWVALAMSFSTMAHADLMQVTGVPLGDSLNVRSGSTASSADIGDLHDGDIIAVKGTSFDGKWSQISFKGQNAWVASRYLTPVQGAPKTTAIGPNVVFGIPADDADGGLVVRAGPDVTENPLGVFPNGSKLHIIQLSADQKWGMIALADRVGWVSTKYLTTEKSSGSAQQNASIAPDGGVLPATFAVTGVQADDRLWVRQSPHASAPKIGGFPNRAIISVDAAAQGNWVQTTLNGQIGYVNARYLIRQSELGSQTSNGFPLGLTCRGTEPFWTLTIAQDRTTEFTSLIGGPDPITALVQTSPSPSGGYPFDFIAGPYSGALNSQNCSDGMSDLSYSMRISFTRQSPTGGSSQFHGCCNLD